MEYTSVETKNLPEDVKQICDAAFSEIDVHARHFACYDQEAFEIGMKLGTARDIAYGPILIARTSIGILVFPVAVFNVQDRAVVRNYPNHYFLHISHWDGRNKDVISKACDDMACEWYKGNPVIKDLEQVMRHCTLAYVNFNLCFCLD